VKAIDGLKELQRVAEAENGDLDPLMS